MKPYDWSIVEPEDPIPDRPRSGAVLVWIVLALGIAAVALFVASRGGV